jgi:RNA polymerase sigma factor (sigma-70 family)
VPLQFVAFHLLTLGGMGSATTPAQHASAEHLLKGAQKGRRADLEELFRRELPPLQRWAFAHVPAAVRRAGETDDFVQLAMLRTLRRLPHLRMADAGTLQPYLRRVLTNLVRDRTRTGGRHPETVQLQDDEAMQTGSQLDTAIVAEAYARYRAAVARLSPRQAAALTARIEEGLDYAAVARRARCASAGAARVMVGRALTRVWAEVQALRTSAGRAGASTETGSVFGQRR